MKINYKDIINKEKGKIALCLGLGPSLKKNLEVIEIISKEEKDKFCTFSCNLFQDLTKIDADYWLIANNQEHMQLNKVNFNNYNGIFLYQNSIDNHNPDEFIQNCINYIQMTSENQLSLQECVSEYCKMPEAPYVYVHSVIVHLVALAIITGCKEILITGVDLDYSHGYVSENFNKESLKMGEHTMPLNQGHVIRALITLNEYAKSVGAEVFCLNDGTKLSENLNKKNISDYLN